MQEAEEAMGSIDTSDFKAADWRVIREQNSGPIALSVDVDPEDGSFVYAPEQ